MRRRATPVLIVLILSACATPGGGIPWTPAAPASTSTSANTPPSDITSPIWIPEIGATWQWQLTDHPIDLSFQTDVYDIDLFDSDADLVRALHDRGIKVICYISVGSWEEWRPDRELFPADVIGKKYRGWPGERWLDIRQIEALAPIMRARFDLCRQKGFDAIEPDNIDAYLDDTGFPLTYQDQLRYNIWIAQEAHQRGLSIGLKNTPEQALDLLPYYDWAMTEGCFDEGWCHLLSPFTTAGKAVFSAEYTDTENSLEDFCPLAEILQFSAILKERDLTAYRESCR